MLPPEKLIINKLLPSIRQEFYCDEKCFYYDKKMLIYALTYLASWLQRHNLKMTDKQYTQTLEKIIKDIKAHGDPQQYSKYLPRYLLKCIQNHLRHHGDAIYQELRCISNTIDQLTLMIEKIEPKPDFSFIEILQRTHALLKPKGQSRHKNDEQMTLF